MTIVVAIDGPAGSGKSTVSKMVAQELGIEVLDTGAMYRAVTWAVLNAGADPTDAVASTNVVETMALSLTKDKAVVGTTDVTAAIRGPEVSDAVSAVSTHSGVRSALRPLQRAWMDQHGGGVVEGRDIGTVVFPDAGLKIYLDADPAIRASRRALEGQFDEVEALANIEQRDRIDSSRDDSPLSAASDAVVIDTSNKTLQEVADEIVGLARMRMEAHGR